MLKLMLAIIPALLLAGCGAGLYTPIGGVGVGTGYGSPPPSVYVDGYYHPGRHRGWW
jgi:hypothetical protein